MDAISAWIPMHWPEAWSQSPLLDLLRETPVNCLVLKWGSRNPAGSFLEQARRRGLALVGRIEGGGDRTAAIRAAETAHLDAVSLDEPAETSLPVILWSEKSKAGRNPGAAGFTIADGVWPSIPPRNESEGGPTGGPWVDSNGWSILLVRALAPGKPVWVSAAPPKDLVLGPAKFALAVADANAYGGRWIITLDDALAAGLAARQPKAVEKWNAIAGAARFFDKHRAWAGFEPCANVAVLSDFAGPNEYAGQELLNLLPRRGVPYRILEKSRAASFEGLAGVVYPDQQQPDEALKRKLLAFAGEGGALVVPAGWPTPEGASPSGSVLGRWKIFALGKGRVVIAAEESTDPYQVASDVPVLIGRRHDLVRYFNFSALNGYYAAADRKAVLHVINYALRPWAHPVSIALARSYRSAQLWSIKAGAPAPIGLVPASTGVELHLPPVEVYAAIELESA